MDRCKTGGTSRIEGPWGRRSSGREEIGRRRGGSKGREWINRRGSSSSSISSSSRSIAVVVAVVAVVAGIGRRNRQKRQSY